MTQRRKTWYILCECRLISEANSVPWVKLDLFCCCTARVEAFIRTGCTVTNWEKSHMQHQGTGRREAKTGLLLEYGGRAKYSRSYSIQRARM